ncbi:TRAP transporter substrate-binding protein [Variovorax sp. dw_308]|uniref:TRAP transporter substrate-binding protein n=1 Tax=Variovorax sp. dw_308 TaxID=2721546 RepID=UPI001C476B5F|nr:TRAP transporter substrate-binding protein DctP [Variovorax sp. dw_308]
MRISLPASRRRALASITGLAAVLGAPRVSAQPRDVTWRMGSSWPTNLPILSEAASDFADSVGKASGGRLQIQVVDPSQHGIPGGLLQAVKEGKFDLAHTTAHYYAKEVPAIDFFTTIPFGLTADENHAWLNFGGGQQLFESVLAPHGILPLTAGNTSVQFGGWFQKEIRSPADLKGVRMRISGFPGQVIGRLGAVPVELPIGKIAQAFEDKQIDAAEAVVPALDALIPFEKHAPLQYGPWHEPDAALHLFVDSAKFAALPADLQQLVRQVAQAAALRSIARGLHQNAPALRAMEARGAIARPWPPSVLAALHQATADEIASVSDPDARRVAASLLAYKARVARYSVDTIGAVLATR